MLKYPEYAQELTKLLHDDQLAWKAFWRDNHEKQNDPDFQTWFNDVRACQQSRSKRMLEILRDIHEPSVSNIGSDAAQAISVIALHDSLEVLHEVVAAFIACYERDKNDTYYQAIPSIVDRIRILERKPQVFGVQWEVGEDGWPFLPTVEDFDTVNERRTKYGIEPLRWPKSLAIPESEQPWLTRPISELTMRDITDEEFNQNYQSYIS